MQSFQGMADRAIFSEIGDRIKKYRLSLNLTQNEFSKRSGVSLSTLIRIENGEDTKFSNIIRVLRTLGMLDNFEVLIPQYRRPPRELFEGEPPRKRASSKKKTDPHPFVWGDETEGYDE